MLTTVAMRCIFTIITLLNLAMPFQFQWTAAQAAALKPFRPVNPKTVERPNMVVTVYEFRAVKTTGAVELTWETANEVNLVGFQIYRRESTQTDFYQINGPMIMAQQPGSLMGSEYHWTDWTAEDISAYEYRLDAIYYVDIESFTAVYDPPSFKVFVPVVIH